MRVAIYTRVSTLDQARDGYSLAAQRKTLESWATEHGHEVSCIYEDAGISGKDIHHRPAMIKMLSDADNKVFDIILIWSLSRLTRSVADLYTTCERLRLNNISLISHTESFDASTPMGRAMTGILGVFSQMEREITAERTKTAMIERAAQGKRTCNAVLGYDIDGKDSFIINENEAERIRYIYDRYLEYHNLSAVAELCNLKGFTGKRGRVFRAEHIKVILTRAIYIGYNSFCGKLYKGMHDPIISQHQWNRVQRALADKRK